MTNAFSRALAASAFAAGLAFAAPASAQGLIDNLFGQRDRAPPADVRQAQGDADLAVRINQLEAQVRQLTGTIEQLQFRNQQLEQQLQRAQVATPGQQAQPAAPIARQPGQAVPPPPASTPSGRRSDVFDPSQNPNAPGAPQTLGGMPAGSAAIPEQPSIITAEPPVGAPGGRVPGAPLDLSTLATGVTGAPAPQAPSNAPLPPPPARNPSATGAVASVMPPSDTPKDHYDLAYGYVLRKDYALAEGAFQNFLKKYPSDRLIPEAQFWLGESLFQRQRYDAAAEAFLVVSTKHDKSPKAPDAFLRLGQSLAAIGQKEMACATLAQVTTKYPRASGSVKQSVEREQKRVRC